MNYKDLFALLRNKIGSLALARRLSKQLYRLRHVENKSNLFPEVLTLIESFDISCFLFYGTLLEHTRNDGVIKYADDFDFILEFSEVEKVKKLTLLDTVEIKSIIISEKIIQLSILYRGASIDFVFSEFKDGNIYHLFPDFRRSHGRLKYDLNHKMKIYEYVYRLKLKIESRNIEGFRCIKTFGNAPDILESIYDDEWHLKKEVNFIDYSNYETIKSACVIYSEFKNDKKEIFNRFNI
jgi:phosphorylcholine metabolism protein LicD